MTHGRNSAHFVFTTFSTIFGYGESNAKSCQAKKIRKIRLFWRIKYDVIMYILCTFANIMNWCEERGDIVFEPMVSTFNKSVRAQPMYTWWHVLVISFTGELLQGHGKVISRSQQGQISSKRLKIPFLLFFAKIMFTWDVYDGSKHSWTQTRTYAKTPQDVTGII